MSLVQVRDGYERGVCGGRQLRGVSGVILVRQSGPVFQLHGGLWETSSKQTQRLELQVSASYHQHCSYRNVGRNACMDGWVNRTNRNRLAAIYVCNHQTCTGID